MSKSLRQLLFICLVLLQASICRALTVGSGSGFDYSTIQDAVDAASSGDTIEVAAGAYGSFSVAGKNLTIAGSGPQSTTINAGGFGHAVNISGGAQADLSGFTITYPGWTMSGVYLNQSKAIIHDCIFDDSGGAYTYGIRDDAAGPSTLTVRNVLIEGYTTFGIWIANGGSSAKIEFCTLDGGGTAFSSIRLDWPVTTEINSCIISRNQNSPFGSIFRRFSNYYQPNVGASSVGNISADPLFLANGSFGLQAGSPSMDAGDPHYLDPDGTRADMGHTGGKGSTTTFLRVPASVPTITTALQAAHSGDTIQIAEGIYDEGITLDNTSPNQIAFEGGYDASDWSRDVASNVTRINAFWANAYFSGSVVLDGLHLQSNASQPVSVSSSATDIIFRDCSITSSTSYGIWLSSVRNALLEGNNIHGNASGLRVDGHTSVSIVNNQVHTNSGYGIYFYNGVTGDIIAGNSCFLNGNTALSVLVSNPGSTPRISQNRVYSNNRVGMYVLGGVPRIDHNIIYKNGTEGLVSASSACVLENNVFAHNTMRGYYITNGVQKPIIRNNIFFGNFRGIEANDRTIPQALDYNCFYGSQLNHVQLPW